MANALRAARVGKLTRVTRPLRVVIVGVSKAEIAQLEAQVSAGIDVHVVGQHVLEANTELALTRVADSDAILVSRSAAFLPRAVGDPATRDGAEAPVFIEALTPREHDVLAGVADGLGNRTIAETLGISEHTVKFHLASLFGKLGVSTRTKAIQRGLQLGIIEI